MKHKHPTPLCTILFFLCAILAGQTVGFREETVSPGNGFVDPVDPKEDDSGQILTSYDQLPDSVKQKIERVLPGGRTEGIGHWGPFRYTVSIRYPDGHENKVYVYLNGRIQQILFIRDGIVERPGVFFTAGTSTSIGLEHVPPSVLSGMKRIVPGGSIVRAWTVESESGPTFVIETLGFQGLDTTAFAFSKDGMLETMTEARRMRQGMNRLWAKAEIENVLEPFRKKYDVDSVLQRIQKVPFDRNVGFRFVVVGDSRINLSVWEAVCKSVSAKNPLFAIDGGDLVNEGEPELYRDYLFGTLEKFGRFFFLPAVGNHDVGYNESAWAYVASFGPHSLNYCFDYGCARFIVWDNSSRLSPAEETLNRVDRWLAETPKGFYKFVFAHYPPEQIAKWSYHAMGEEASRRFTELMSEHHVTHVFVGHIHAYSTATYRGVDYTVTGGGGADLHKQFGPMGSVHHYVVVDVKSDGVRQQVVHILENTSGSSTGENR